MLIFVQGQSNIPLDFLKQDSDTGDFLFQFDIPANTSSCFMDEVLALNNEYVIFSQNTTILTVPDSWGYYWVKQ